jgi:hypothetical protein
MRVILDECLPRKLGLELVGHIVTTVPQAGWAGILNGRLLGLIGGNFDAFVTVDKNLPAQQKTGILSFGVIVLRAPSNRLRLARFSGHQTNAWRVADWSLPRTGA